MGDSDLGEKPGCGRLGLAERLEFLFVGDQDLERK